ncbi:MAG: hypothetical protein ABSG19_13985 [Candidatus Aminicenantales bacterium]
MKLTPEGQKRLQRAIRLTHQIMANFARENGSVQDTRPKRGGHAFRKRRSYHSA